MSRQIGRQTNRNRKRRGGRRRHLIESVQYLGVPCSFQHATSINKQVIWGSGLGWVHCKWWQERGRVTVPPLTERIYQTSDQGGQEVYSYYQQFRFTYILFGNCTKPVIWNDILEWSWWLRGVQWLSIILSYWPLRNRLYISNLW